MNILKASAGSGKTYRLAHTYINLLLNSEDPREYRHILAVTFTNKATAEMKSRILKELAAMSDKNPRAREILIDILHDYGAFAVSTIDKFFQTALKAFAREIGQMADYQIELEREALINEAMDRILDSLTEESTDMLGWLRADITRSLETGGRPKIEDRLHDMGKLLKNQDHRQMCEQAGVAETDGLTRKKLSETGAECWRIIRSFEAKADNLGVQFEPGEKVKMPSKKALAASEELAELFEEHYTNYLTALAVHKAVFSLGVAEDFYREFDALLAEKNIMCLDESNLILRDIIDGSDAPFVYEKTGVRYRHFLLDEFQDTSRIQWENFLPLLRESEASGGDSLVVGDVKQSIYRWRDSDWSLLARKVEEEFPSADVEVLDNNWRSQPAIIDFNNGFFAYAAVEIDVEDIYADVAQTPRTRDPQRGYVRVSFRDDQLDAVVESVRDAVAAGAQLSDIAVITRTNTDGAAVASRLIAEGIAVVSDDSLLLKSSITVRRLASLLSCVDNPDNLLSGFLSRDLGVELPASYHSLVDLCHELLRRLRESRPGETEGESLYIQAFLDNVQTWTDTYGNDLRGFLKHWDESDPSIGSPQGGDAVRILTIHKSKGLEFEHLIFPFANKVKLYRNDFKWCRSGLYDGIFPINLTNDTELTEFGPYLQDEKRKQLVDSINLFYVAFTRACKSLHVIAAEPSKKCRDSVGKNPHYGNFAELLYHYVGGMDEYVYGEPYDFSSMERKESAEMLELRSEFRSIAMGDRLKPSSDASDYFGEDGVCGVEASPRLAGIALHGILEDVTGPDSLDAAVAKAVASGAISGDGAEEARSLLAGRIAAHPEFFTGRCYNEVTIIDSYGNEYRPDHVVIDGDRVTVIDYKFGDMHPGYKAQVQRYMKLYRQMGYSEVKGALWFVRTDELVEFSGND